MIAAPTIVVLEDRVDVTIEGKCVTCKSYNELIEQFGKMRELMLRSPQFRAEVHFDCAIFPHFLAGTWIQHQLHDRDMYSVGVDMPIRPRV